MERKETLSILSVLSGFFIMGFCDIVGLASDYVQKAFDWSPIMTGFVPSLVFIWFLFLGIPIGTQMNKLGRKNMVILGMAVTIVGMFIPLLSYNSISCMITFIFLGIGNTILQVSLNPLLTNVITNKRLLTSSLTTGQVIKAISSLVGPEIILFSVSFFNADKWYYCFPILGLFTIISAISLLVSPIPQEERMEETDSKKAMLEAFSLLKDKRILCLFLGIFFIVGVDVSTNFISSKIMAQRFMWSAEQVKYAPQVYFLSRTIGAFLGAFLLTRIHEVKYFRVNILACALVLLAWAFIDQEIVNILCIGGVGFFASSVFSIIYSIAMQLRPDKANQISGLMITAIAGGAVVTPLIGMVTSFVGIIGGIWVTLGCVIYLMCCAFNKKLSI